MTASAAREAGLRSIGEVIAALSGQFPGLSVAKIRLWEAQGIVQPGRTSSGYRMFSDTDVERLRYAMTLQREHFWPLRRIREHLQAVAQGREDLHVGAPPTRAPATARSRLSAGQICRQSGISAEQLEEFVTFGLLQPTAAGWYDNTDLDIAMAGATLAQYGVSARHLRFFRTAVDRELGLLTQIVAPRRRGPGTSAATAAQETAATLANAATQLHDALLQSGLQRAGLA